MQRWASLAELPDSSAPAVVSIGNFDGVHRGHQVVLEHARSLADAQQALSVVVTFSPHPMTVIRPDKAPPTLTTMDYRCDVLAEHGVDAVLVLPFTPQVARWSPTRFVDDVLVRGVAAATVVVGQDFRFGMRGSGSVATLVELGQERGFEVVAIEDVVDRDRRWSSTWARDVLAQGDVQAARQILTRPHRVDGVVVHGDHRGRDLGYPTANVAAECLVPADGVYAGWVVQLGLDAGDAQYRLPAAVSVGTNPTFDGVDQRCEAYVLDRTDLDLYGHRIGVEFVQRLRGTVKFDSLPELLDQMALDVQQCREILGPVR